jgi:hypothetical protein
MEQIPVLVIVVQVEGTAIVTTCARDTGIVAMIIYRLAFLLLLLPLLLFLLLLLPLLLLPVDIPLLSMVLTAEQCLILKGIPTPRWNV